MKHILGSLTNERNGRRDENGAESRGGVAPQEQRNEEMKGAGQESRPNKFEMAFRFS